ncbi:MAG: periplasmic thiol:disulfide oxidoreductase, DsbE subfamily protein, partial [Pseudomonadota bacterium]
LNLLLSRVVLPLRYKNESLLLARRLVRYVLMLIAIGIVAAYLFDDLTSVVTTVSVASAALVISLQDVLTSVFGWFVIMSSGKIRLGDRVEIDGVAIRDTEADLRTFLARNGNPYARIGADPVSKIQFDIGSAGVPESFVIDAKGVIRYQHIGVIMPDQVPLILAKLKEAEQ